MKSHLQHPSQKLNFVFEVGDAGLVGGDDLLEELFIGADTIFIRRVRAPTGEEKGFIEVGQVIGMYTEGHGDLLKPLNRHPHFASFDSTVPAGGHSYALSDVFLREVFEFAYLFNFGSQGLAEEWV